jgi:hypothetical protein
MAVGELPRARAAAPVSSGRGRAVRYSCFGRRCNSGAPPRSPARRLTHAAARSAETRPRRMTRSTGPARPHCRCTSDPSPRSGGRTRRSGRRTPRKLRFLHATDCVVHRIREPVGRHDGSLDCATHRSAQTSPVSGRSARRSEWRCVAGQLAMPRERKRFSHRDTGRPCSRDGAVPLGRTSQHMNSPSSLSVSRRLRICRSASLPFHRPVTVRSSLRGRTLVIDTRGARLNRTFRACARENGVRPRSRCPTGASATSGR